MVKFQLKNISKSFNDSLLFENINLIAKSGEIIAIKGKSGVGKSTLLNIIAGLESPSSGEYQLDHINMESKKMNELAKIRGEKIGYISQFSPMVPKLTVIDNICIPLLFSKQREDVMKARRKRVEELSQLFEIDHLLNAKIEKLSGGEIQRVGIIRALINDPQIIVADEPTGSLDDESTLIILNHFQKLKVEGLLVVLATHSSMVAEQSDHVYNLTREGLVLEKDRG